MVPFRNSPLPKAGSKLKAALWTLASFHPGEMRRSGVGEFGRFSPQHPTAPSPYSYLLSGGIFRICLASAGEAISHPTSLPIRAALATNWALLLASSPLL